MLYHHAIMTCLGIVILIITTLPRGGNGFDPLDFLLGTGEAVEYERVADLLTDTKDGKHLAPRGVALPFGAFTQLTDVSYDVPRLSGDLTPEGIAMAKAKRECSIVAPRSGEKVLTAFAAESARQSNIEVYSKKDLQAIAEQSSDSVDANAFRMGIVDVFVTETKSPVHLVLQSAGPRILWHVHPADGVDIRQIVLVGNNGAGIAGVEDAEGYELVSHECFPEIADIATLNQPSGQEGTSAYDNWMVDTFGAAQFEMMVGFHSVAHVLLGPLPDSDARVRYQSLSNSQVFLEGYSGFVVGSASDRQAQRELLFDETFAGTNDS